jgi:hypothetical protein
MCVGSDVAQRLRERGRWRDPVWIDHPLHENAADERLMDGADGSHLRGVLLLVESVKESREPFSGLRHRLRSERLKLGDRLLGTFVPPHPGSDPPQPGLVEPTRFPESWIDLLLLRSSKPAAQNERA